MIVEMNFRFPDFTVDLKPGEVVHVISKASRIDDKIEF